MAVAAPGDAGSLGVVGEGHVGTSSTEGWSGGGHPGYMPPEPPSLPGTPALSSACPLSRRATYQIIFRKTALDSHGTPEASEP